MLVHRVGPVDTPNPSPSRIATRCQKVTTQFEPLQDQNAAVGYKTSRAALTEQEPITHFDRTARR